MTELATRNAATVDHVGAADLTDQHIVRYLGLDPTNPAHRAQVAVCQHYGFDPVLKHVVVIPKGGVYVTRDGLLHVAHRSGQLDGIVVEQEPTLSKDGTEWVARVAVYRKDMSHPFTFPGRYAAKGGNTAYAPEMALKAAEAHALRRAFDITGISALDERRDDGPNYDADEPTPTVTVEDIKASRASREAEGQVTDVALPDEDVAANDPSLLDGE